MALQEVKNLVNSSIHRLMAMKFVKSLLTLTDKEIIEEIKNYDIFGCVETIINDTRNN